MDYYVYMMTNSHRNVLYTGVTNDLQKEYMNIKNTWIREVLQHCIMLNI